VGVSGPLCKWEMKIGVVSRVKGEWYIIPTNQTNQMNCEDSDDGQCRESEAIAFDWLANRDSVRFFSLSPREKDGTLVFGTVKK
jgi:hypothetical protein